MDWKEPLLTIKSKKYYLKTEVDQFLSKLYEQWTAQQQEFSECKAALESYQAQERKIASVLISSQELAEQQLQMMREKAKEELLIQEEKRRKVEREIALMVKNQKEIKATYAKTLQALCQKFQEELLPILNEEN